VRHAGTASEFIPISVRGKWSLLSSEILTLFRLKCNRTNPCDNCVRRGDANSCSYAAPSTRKKNQSQGATSPDDMQTRIDRLEGLVLSLMTNGAQSAGPAAAVAAISRSQSDSAASSFPPDQDREEDDDMIKEEDEDGESDVEGVTNSLGILKVDADQGKSMYYGDSHWHMVLSDVSFWLFSPNLFRLVHILSCIPPMPSLLHNSSWTMCKLTGLSRDERDCLRLRETMKMASIVWKTQSIGELRCTI